ncbi:hypothetical protein [Micromonospora sp. NPDC023644]|uniref:hypothetical protein n=1 Tax=Micromonospora sp. NPDC023644 TaxID=3154321 RepID=UPI0033F2EA7F
MHPTFTGLLLLPLTSPLRRTVTVTFHDRTPAAVIRRRFVSKRRRFEIRDAAAATLLATGATTSFANDHYELRGPRSEFILSFMIDYEGRRRGTVTLADGRTLTTVGNRSARDFTITDQSGGPVAMLVTTSSAWSMRSADLALEVRAPVMSLLQAIGMAQCLLTAVGSPRGDAT